MSLGISAAGWAAISAVGGMALTAKSASDQKKQQQAAIDSANAKGGIPDWARPYVDEAMGKAQAVANKPYEAYGGQRVAGQNAYGQLANDTMTNWAMGTPQAAKMNAAYDRMVSNPNQFGQGAASLSAAYADNHLGELSTTKAGEGMFSAASNPYIGAQSQGIAGVDKIGGSMGANPYLGQSSGSVSAGKNPMLGLNNPYLNDAINYATEDVTKAYDRSIRPMQAQRAAASGSFGNTGVEAANAEDASNLAGQLGRTVSGMRMQDYTAQQGLQEANLNRQLGADQFNVQSRAGDLGRNMAGMFQQQGMGLDAEKANASNQLNTQQFNAQLGQADLARNSSLAGQQGQFNSTGAANMSQFNTSQGNAANNQNATMANGMSLANAGIQNTTQQNNINSLMRAGEYNANSANEMNRFNTSLAASQQAQGLAGLANMDQRGFQAGNVLGAIGQQERGYAQQGLDSAYQMWQQQQQYPQQQSQNYNSALTSLVHGQQQQIQQPQASPLLQGLSTGMGIYSMFNQNSPSTPGSTSPYMSSNAPSAGLQWDGSGWVSPNGSY